MQGYVFYIYIYLFITSLYFYFISSSFLWSERPLTALKTRGDPRAGRQQRPPPLFLHWGDVHVAGGVSGGVGQILLQHHEGGDQTRHDHQNLLTGGDGRSSLQTGRNGKETIVECGFHVKIHLQSLILHRICWGW